MMTSQELQSDTLVANGSAILSAVGSEFVLPIQGALEIRSHINTTSVRLLFSMDIKIDNSRVKREFQDENPNSGHVTMNNTPTFEVDC